MNGLAFVRFFATWVFFVISCNAFSQEKVYQKGLLAVQEQPKAEKKYAPNGTHYDFGKTYFGRLKLVTTSMKNGDMITLNAVTGELSVALTDAELCIFSRSTFDSFARQHPELEHKLLRRTLNELDRAQSWMLLLGKKTATERIATLLLEMSVRLSETGCTVDDDALDTFELPLDRQQIGDVLGLTIETVSRQFSKLKADGIIHLPDRRSVSIRDRARLQELSAAV